jgi:glucosamine-phosphate N-acetyltransferase
LIPSEEITSLPSEEYHLRPLRRDDHSRGFTQLLSQLTEVGQVDELLFEATFDEMKHCGIYYVTVIESHGRIVATTTLFLERKFIHSCALVCLIVNIVIQLLFTSNLHMIYILFISYLFLIGFCREEELKK